MQFYENRTHEKCESASANERNLASILKRNDEAVLRWTGIVNKVAQQLDLII